MLSYVYPLYRDGVRLPVEEVLRAPPCHGWLAYNRPHPWGTPGSHAELLKLFDGAPTGVPVLQHATVRRIDGGLLLSGSDGLSRYRQQLWAVAHTADEVVQLVRSLKQRSEVRRAMVAAEQEIQLRHQKAQESK